MTSTSSSQSPRSLQVFDHCLFSSRSVVLVCIPAAHLSQILFEMKLANSRLFSGLKAAGVSLLAGMITWGILTLLRLPPMRATLIVVAIVLAKKLSRSLTKRGRKT